MFLEELDLYHEFLLHASRCPLLDGTIMCKIKKNLLCEQSFLFLDRQYKFQSIQSKSIKCTFMMMLGQKPKQTTYLTYHDVLTSVLWSFMTAMITSSSK